MTKMLSFTLPRNSGIGSVVLTCQECTLGRLIGQHSALSDGVEARVEAGSTSFFSWQTAQHYFFFAKNPLDQDSHCANTVVSLKRMRRLAISLRWC